jgi:hypothetical protein
MGMMGGRVGMMRMHMGMPGMMGMAPWRHFINRDEIIARLEGYLKQLQAEEKGVAERIEEIKKRGQSEQA